MNIQEGFKASTGLVGSDVGGNAGAATGSMAVGPTVRVCVALSDSAALSGTKAKAHSAAIRSAVAFSIADLCFVSTQSAQ